MSTETDQKLITKIVTRRLGLAVLFIVGTLYLVIPAPDQFPDLPNSYKSVEPGDTVQIRNVAAYYTDDPREVTTGFYRRYFSYSPFLNLPLPTIRLNHPPERIREVLRDTQQATFAEEYVHPMRESVFVSGFEWNNDPFTPPARRIKNAPFVNDRTYAFKITVFYQPTPVWQRLLVYYLLLILGYLLTKQGFAFIQRLKSCFKR